MGLEFHMQEGKDMVATKRILYHLMAGLEKSRPG